MKSSSKKSSTKESKELPKSKPSGVAVKKESKELPKSKPSGVAVKKEAK